MNGSTRAAIYALDVLPSWFHSFTIPQQIQMNASIHTVVHSLQTLPSWFTTRTITWAEQLCCTYTSLFNASLPKLSNELKPNQKHQHIEHPSKSPPSAQTPYSPIDNLKQVNTMESVDPGPSPNPEQSSCSAATAPRATLPSDLLSDISNKTHRQKLQRQDPTHSSQPSASLPSTQPKTTRESATIRNPSLSRNILREISNQPSLKEAQHQPKPANSPSPPMSLFNEIKSKRPHLRKIAEKDQTSRRHVLSPMHAAITARRSSIANSDDDVVDGQESDDDW
jgi:hypothetical protein